MVSAKGYRSTGHKKSAHGVVSRSAEPCRRQKNGDTPAGPILSLIFSNQPLAAASNPGWLVVGHVQQTLQPYSLALAGNAVVTPRFTISS
jgi:hypothetical protein